MRRTQTEVEQKLNEQTLDRIAQMERPGYPFPRRFSRGDYVLWAVITLFCLLMLVLGARL